MPLVERPAHRCEARRPDATGADGTATVLPPRRGPCQSQRVLRTASLRFLAVVFTAFGARQSLALLRIFLAPEALRGPRAALALCVLPSLVAFALALVPSADGDLAATALYAPRPRRAATVALTRAASATVFTAFVALHVALAPTYASRPLAVGAVELSLAAAFGTFATTLASALRFTTRPAFAFGSLVIVTVAAELLARTAPVGEIASAWLSPMRSLVLQLLAFDARPTFFLALLAHTALATLALYTILSEPRFVRLARKSFGGLA
jgi:hypothetical protein